MMRLCAKSVVTIVTIAALGACASTSTNMNAEQLAERGAVMIVMKEVGGKTIHLTGAAVDSEGQQFSKDVLGFFMNLGETPQGVLPAIFSNTITNVVGENDARLEVTFKNLPAGQYAFVGLYDVERSNCFDKRTKIFDVEPGYVNLVTLPASKGFLKKGFFKSAPETPSVDWDYSVDLSNAALLQLYKANLKDHFQFDMPVRVSNFTEASFEARSKPKLSYVCLLPADMKYTLR